MGKKNNNRHKSNNNSHSNNKMPVEEVNEEELMIQCL
jgi:hypothetical protein